MRNPFLARMFWRQSATTMPPEWKLRFIPRLERLEERETPAAYAGTFAVSVAGPGGPRVQVYQLNSAGGFNLVADFFAYTPGYTGGVSVAVGDINGDGVNDIITCTMTGVAHVKVFAGIGNGAGGLAGVQASPIASFFAPGLMGGKVAVGNFDTTNDGPNGVVRNEIAVSSPAGQPRVEIFRNDVPSGTVGGMINPNLNSFTPHMAASFYAGSPASAGGVSLAAGHLDNAAPSSGAAADELIVGTGVGSVGTVLVYNFNRPGLDPANALNVQGSNSQYQDRIVAAFQPFGPNFTGGVNVAAGHIISNTADTAFADEIIVGAQTGSPIVQVYRPISDASGQLTGVNTSSVQSFSAFTTSAGYNGGVSVGFNNGTGSAAAILVGPGNSKPPAALAKNPSLASIFQAAQLPGVFETFNFLPGPGTFGESARAAFDLGYLGGLSFSD